MDRGSYDDGGDGRSANYIMRKSVTNEKRKQMNDKCAIIRTGSGHYNQSSLTLVRN